MGTIFAGSPAYCQSWKTIGDLPAYVPVSSNLFRGGQPSAQGLQELKDKGIKTIISLRNNRGLTTLESNEAKRIGMEFVSIPLNGIQKPSDKAVTEFLKIVDDPKCQPVFVHCEEGVDRTGTMIGIYRIAVDHWSAEDAYKEMVQRGFHPIYVWLTDAVFDFEGRQAKVKTAVKGRPLLVKVLDTVEGAANLFAVRRSAGETVDSSS